MAGICGRPLIALEIDGITAILNLVADGAGSAVLSRNTVTSSQRPVTLALIQATARAQLGTH